MVGIKMSDELYRIITTDENDFISGFMLRLSLDTISYLAVENEDTISFISETKIRNEYVPFKDKMKFSSFVFSNESDMLWSKYRTKIKIGRYVKRLLMDRRNKEILDEYISEFKYGLGDTQFLHLDRYVEIFVNNFKALYIRANNKDFYNRIETVQGEDIRYWYDGDNYLSSNGSLGNSCMRWEECQSYLDIYVDNPDVCKMLILREGKKLSIRALLWTLPDGSKYLDRVYSITESDGIIFMNYAKDMGWQHYTATSKPDIWIETPTVYEKYPFMDTFKYLDMKTHKYYSKFRRGTYELEGQRGDDFEKAREERNSINQVFPC